MATDKAAAFAPLRVEVVNGPAGPVVTISGRINAGSLTAARDALHRVVDTGAGDVVLMLGEAEIGDASALGVLAGAHHRARRAGRRLVIAQTSARTARLLRLSGLHRVLVGAGVSTSEPVAALTASLRG